ncbi:hypothetical protein [Candidatus Aquicultor sp.]
MMSCRSGSPVSQSQSNTNGTSANHQNAAGTTKTSASSTVNIRSSVKAFIDRLSKSTITDIGHTTRGLSEPAIRLPEEPMPFSAGRFAVSFDENGVVRVIICQTEEVVGHLNQVIPGKTVIGGYVQLLDNPSDVFGPGPKLNSAELDYLIETLYKKFRAPLEDEQHYFLNSTKDFVLAIKFNGKPGIEEYHKKLVHSLLK